MSIFSVYIEEGCITCDACEEAAPEVFEVTDDTCFIRSDARIDGGFDRNDTKSGLKKEVVDTYSDDILDAADACPVDVIIVLEGDQKEEESELPVEIIASTAEPSDEKTEEDPVIDGLEDLLYAGDRSLEILFGSQSGNSEGLASKMAKEAKAYGLEGNVHDMDGFDFNSLSDKKRVIVVCSTWVKASSLIMQRISGSLPSESASVWREYSAVCALGDTSYALFCESGKEWDKQFETLGATRLIDRIDCDVDYDAPAAEWLLDALPALAAVDSTGKYHENG